jgi:FkbM family methyltransferase
MNLIAKLTGRRHHPDIETPMTPQDEAAVRATPPFVTGHTRVYGHPVTYSDRDGLLHSVNEIFRDEVYRFTAKSDAPHIIDAGANIGLSVRYFKRLYPAASIVAYEPDAAIFPLLEQNTEFLAGVTVRQAAAWIDEDDLTFYSEGSLAGSSQMDFLGKGEVTTVRAERLRDEIAKQPVDFLKIDIEGGENRVLFDIADVLDQVDHLFFEYHSVPGEAQKLGDMLNLVRDAGFRYVINGTHGPRLPFVEKVSHGFDLQLNVMCFR